MKRNEWAGWYDIRFQDFCRRGRRPRGLQLEVRHAALLQEDEEGVEHLVVLAEVVHVGPARIFGPGAGVAADLMFLHAKIIQGLVFSGCPLS